MRVHLLASGIEYTDVVVRRHVYTQTMFVRPPFVMGYGAMRTCLAWLPTSPSRLTPLSNLGSDTNPRPSPGEGCRPGAGHCERSFDWGIS